jgi:hypothetical protein
MTNDGLDLLYDFRSEVSPPDEATRRRVFRASTAASPPRRAQRAPYRPLGRPRLVSRRILALSATATAALAITGVLVGLTLSAAAPASAYAAAKKAIAATSAGAIDSGTMTSTFAIGNHTTNQTTHWDGNDLSITGDDGSLWGATHVLLIEGNVYVQQADGTWQHYTSEADAGQFATAVQTARVDVAGNSAAQILALVPDLQKTTQADGSTVYTGTIPATGPATVSPTDNTATRLGARLKSIGRVSEFRLVVGNDGLVRQLSETADDGSTSWTVHYSQLGSTPPIHAPTSEAPTPEKSITGVKARGNTSLGASAMVRVGAYS